MIWSLSRRALSSLLLRGFLLCGSGCSYAFVHAPSTTARSQESAPEIPRTVRSCASSNAAPIVDTIVSVISVSAVVAGSLMYADSKKSLTCSPPSYFCPLGQIGTGLEEATGVGAIIAGGIGTLLFVPSAVTGYGRTADCRRLEESPPGGSYPSARHLLDLNGIVAARSREEHERP